MIKLYRVEGLRLLPAGEARMGTWGQGAAFSTDGRTLVVQNMHERELQVFRVEENGPQDTGQRLPVNGGPAAIRTAERGR